MQPLHAPTHDPPLEAELILAQIHAPQREAEQLHVRPHDRLQELDQPQDRREAIQQHDLQHVLRIVQHALIHARERRDLRHVRVLLLQQGLDQALQHEALEVAAAVAALHEEEIIRHK